MTSLRNKVAVVIGASSGVGRATVTQLLAEGARVTAIARGAEGLARLSAETKGVAQTIPADATDPNTANRVLRELRPDLVILSAGQIPNMQPIDEQTWETFSEPWNSDMKAAFHVVQSALTVPLAPGSTVVIVSSGAAINGSPLSGGYAGAKRMQWLLAGYAQKISDAKKLGIRFVAVVPTQLIQDTPIGDGASAAYGALQGISGSDFMKRFDVPLDVEKVGAAILSALRGELEATKTALGVNGKGAEALA